MADLTESEEWTPGIYQIETSDPVLGGPLGISNQQGKQLANRTRWLKGKIDALIDGALSVAVAVKLATARTISISGAGTGSAAFDGSANAEIALTLANSGVTAGSYAKVTVNAKGLVTGGGALASGDLPNGITAPQFDVSQKLATSAFIKASGLQVNNIGSRSSPGSIPVSALGGEYVLSGTGGYTVVLPTSVGQPAGAYGQMLVLLNTAVAPITVSVFGSENITAGNNSISAFFLLSGDRAILTMASANYWHLIGGEASLKYSGSFENSLSGQWSTLPGGLIEVRGAFVSPATPGSATAVTFPFAFPNGIQEILVSVASATNIHIGAWSSNPSKTGFNGRCSEASASCYYIAKGF